MASAALQSVTFERPSTRHLRFPRDLTENMDAPPQSDASAEAGERIWAPTGLRRLVVALRDACLLLVVGTTGMRLGELLAIRGGRATGATLPDCIVVRRSEDGMFDLFFVVSSVDKGHSVPTVDEWLLGSAVTGSTTLPLPVQAIVTLEDLMSPWRPHATDPVCHRVLAVGFSAGGGMPSEPGRVVRLTDHRFGQRAGWRSPNPASRRRRAGTAGRPSRVPTPSGRGSGTRSPPRSRIGVRLPSRSACPS